MLPRNQQFGADERLKRKKEIEKLFKDGFSFFSYPFKIRFAHQTQPAQYPAVLISVPKRNFRLATARNRIKRLVREAYRRQKTELFLPHADQLPTQIALLYIAKKPLSLQELDPLLAKALKDALQAFRIALADHSPTKN